MYSIILKAAARKLKKVISEGRKPFSMCVIDEKHVYFKYKDGDSEREEVGKDLSDIKDRLEGLKMGTFKRLILKDQGEKLLFNLEFDKDGAKNELKYIF